MKSIRLITGSLVILVLSILFMISRGANVLDQNVTYAVVVPALPLVSDAMTQVHSAQIAAAEETNLTVTSNYDVVQLPSTNSPVIQYFNDPATGPFIQIEDASNGCAWVYYSSNQYCSHPYMNIGLPIYDTNGVDIVGYESWRIPFVQTNQVTVTIGGMLWKCETNPLGNWFGIGVDNQDGTYGVDESTSLPVIGKPVIVLGATNNLISIIQTPLNHE